MNPMLIAVILLAVWGGAIVMFILAFTTKTAQQVFRDRIRREVQREEHDLLEKKLEEEEMKKPLIERMLTPIFSLVGNKLMRKSQGAQGQNKIDDMLDKAGRPWGLNAVSFMGLKLFSAASLGLFALFNNLIIGPFIDRFVFNTIGFSILPLLYAFVFVFAGIGFIIPTFMLGRHIKKRRKKIGKAMADTVDLITLSLEAGLGFDGAVGHAVKNTRGPLSEELSRVMSEVAAGKPQSDAFRDMAVRAKMPELSLLVAAIDQAMKLGVNLAASLRTQATEIRERRSAAAREAAAKLPVKMIFPLVFCIFPALFIVILGPAGIQMYEINQAGYL